MNSNFNILSIVTFYLSTDLCYFTSQKYDLKSIIDDYTTMITDSIFLSNSLRQTPKSGLYKLLLIPKFVVNKGEMLYVGLYWWDNLNNSVKD